MSRLADAFGSPLFRRAVVEAVLVGVIAGLVGVHVVLRRLPFFVTAMSHATFPGVVGTAMTKVCDLEIARTGLQESEAVEAGLAFEAVTIESRTRAGYFPGSRPMTVKMLAERRTGRLLGAQIVGGDGSAKRIDVCAVALWNRMTVAEVAGLDLGYAPPFSPVWDPVQVAARKAAAAVTP